MKFTLPPFAKEARDGAPGAEFFYIPLKPKEGLNGAPGHVCLKKKPQVPRLALRARSE